MAKWVGVVGEDVVRDDTFGFNVVLEVVAGFEAAAERRARAAVASRFPKTLGRNEAVSTVMVGDAAIPMMEKYRVTVFVPTEGIRSAGAGTPIQTLLKEVDNRIIDPITGRFMER